VLSVIFLLPETNQTPNRALSIDLWRSVKNVVYAFNLKTLRPLFASNFVFQSGFGFYVGFASVFLMERFGFTQSSLGNFFAYVGLWIAFTQAVITGLAARKFREYQVLRVTMFGAGICLMLYFVPTVWWGLLFVAPFLAICVGLYQANMAGLVSRSAGAEIQGEVLGINASVQALGISLPPMLSGFIAASITPEAPLLVSSILIICAALLFAVWYRPPSRA
jgi:DHA1 family tetracycline resistance protein-like MFS transporter